MKNRKLFFAPLAVALLTIPISSMAGMVSVGTGFDYSSGDYGESTDTEIIYVPFNIQYQTGLLTLKGTIPYESISSGGNVIGGGSNVVVIDGTTTAGERESGLGDIVLAATAFVYEGAEGQPLIPMVDLTGKVKLPTADEDKGLGTGEADYSLQGDFTWFTGKTAVFTTIGYKFMGDPDEYELNNVLYGSIGFSRQIGHGFSAGLMYDAREASTDEGPEVSEATPFVNYKLSDTIKFLLYGVIGLADGSPDYGIGFTVSYLMDADEIDWMAPVRRISNL